MMFECDIEYYACGIKCILIENGTTSAPEKVPTLRLTNCPDFKFWLILLVVFANTASILKVYVSRVGVV